VIRPALAGGQTVLCDRYFDATLVYQGAARGLPSERILSLHAIMFDGLTPDLTLLLDLPVETGLARARRQLSKGARPRKESRFEDEALQFHERVRAGYLELARQHPGRFRVIDAAADEARVRVDIERAVAPFLPRSGTI
jgi:dTMP kinase